MIQSAVHYINIFISCQIIRNKSNGDSSRPRPMAEADAYLFTLKFKTH